MDHLPMLSDPAYPPIEVPNIVIEEYDNLDFRGYPKRRGWDSVQLIQGLFTQRSYQETGPFLQTWLFFGMLHEVTQMEISSKAFTRYDQLGRALIDTTALASYIQSWRRSFKRLSGQEREIRLQEISDCFKIVHGLCFSTYFEYFNSLERDERELSDQPLRCPLSFEIILSVMVLGSTLNSAIGEMDKSGNFERFPWGGVLLGLVNREGQADGKAVTILDPLSKRMVDSGWCKNDLARLQVVCFATGIYYSSFLRRNQVPRDHTKCTTEQCIANQVNEEDYVTAHVTRGCDCSHIKSPLAQVSSILASGGLPVITATIGSGGTPELEAVPFKKGLKYVAISHVWSDGLGNATDNSLPTCQLIRLTGLLEGMTSEKLDLSSLFRKSKSEGSKVRFWMDTLCIPLEKQLRRLAISRMRDSYQLSHKVLVLEAECQAASMNSSPEESILRIGISSWMRRIWTTQEGEQTAGQKRPSFVNSSEILGLLARKLFVNFADGILDVSKTIDLLGQKGFDPEFAFQSISLEVANLLWFFTQAHERNNREQLLLIMGSFSSRVTSKPGDGILCLASLLQTDPALLLDVPAEERMKVLLKMQPQLPAKLIFHTGVRMSGDGNRWIPSSFNINSEDDLIGIPQELGLQVQYPGFIIDHPGIPLFPPGYPGGFEFRSYIFIDRSDAEARSYKISQRKVPHNMAMDQSNLRDIEGVRKSVIILPNIRWSRSDIDGIQCVLYKSSGGVHYVRFESNVRVGIERGKKDGKPQFESLLEQRMDTSVFPDNSVFYGEGWSQPSNTTWVVG